MSTVSQSDITTYYKIIERRLTILYNKLDSPLKCLLTAAQLDNIDVIGFHKATRNDILFCKIISDMLTQNFLVSNTLKNYMISECTSLDTFQYIFSVMSPENAEVILNKLSKKCNLLPVYFPSNLKPKEHQALQNWYGKILYTMTTTEIEEAQIPLDNIELNIIAYNLGVWK
jgi:hypothetical protein